MAAQSEDRFSFAIGDATKISITIQQLTLLRKATSIALGHHVFLSELELQGIEELRSMLTTTIKEPGPQGTLHGFAL